jgi:type II secretion system protein D
MMLAIIFLLTPHGIVLAQAPPLSPPAIPPAASPTLKAYPLRYLDAEQAANIIRTLVVGNIDPSVVVTAEPTANEIWVRTSAAAQVRVAELVKSLDQPSLRPSALSGNPTSPTGTPLPLPLAPSAPETATTIPPWETPIVATPPLTSIQPDRSPTHTYTPPASPQVPVTPQTIVFEAGTGGQIQESLTALLGRKLAVNPRAPSLQPAPTTYSFMTDSGDLATLEFPADGRSVMLSGASNLTAQLARLIQHVDQSYRTDIRDTQYRFVPLRMSDPAKVRQAVDAVRAGYQTPARIDAPVEPQSANFPNTSTHTVNQYGQGSRTTYAPDRFSGSVSERNAYWGSADSGVHPAAYFQTEDVSPGSGTLPPGLTTNPMLVTGETLDGSSATISPTTPSTLADDTRPPLTNGGPESGYGGPTSDIPGEEDAFNLPSDVLVEMMPDLDVVIVRGSDAAIPRIVEIIQAIERISEETEPQIEIYEFQHIDCVSVGYLLAQTYENYLGSRHGRCWTLPLMKPNALLLIGWGDAVNGVKDLLAELDQPVPPESQFHMIPLRHISATLLSATIQQMFPMTPPGSLAPRVRVIPDVRTNSVIIQAAPRDLVEVEALVRQLDVEEGESVAQVRMIQLKNSLVTDMIQTIQEAIAASSRPTPGGRLSVLELLTIESGQEQVLRSGLLNDVQFTGNTRTNTIIVSGPAESMPLIELLVEQLDQPSGVAQIKVFQIVNGDATSLVATLQSLIPSQIAGQPSAALPGALGEESLVPVRFAVDSRTNTIIAAGSEGDLRMIEALLLRLDMQDLDSRTSLVIRLENAPADSVAVAVNEYLRSRREIQQAAPGVISPYQQLASEIIVVPDAITNSLLINATPEYHEEIFAMIQDLDAQPAQVMIQVMIAEVALNDTDEFGVELGLQDSVLFDRSLLGDLESIRKTTTEDTGSGVITTVEDIILAATLNPGFDFNTSSGVGSAGSTQSLATSNLVGTQGLTSLGLDRVNDDLGFGGFVFSASSESVSVLVRALQENRRLEVLSRPQVTTLDNQPAFIQVGKEVARITQARIDERTGSQTNSFQMVPIGLIVEVTPRVSPDGKIVMAVDAEKSSLDPVDQGVPIAVTQDREVRAPNISMTRAVTTVSASNGETIVIGGLITKRTTEIHRQVPILGEIPLLGHLFGYDLEGTERSELLIILTPRIVLNGEDAERIKEAEMARMHWTLQDVAEIQGDVGLYDLTAERPAIGDAPIIQPPPLDIDNDADLEELPSLPSPMIPPTPAPLPVQLPTMDASPVEDGRADVNTDSEAPRLRDRVQSVTGREQAAIDGTYYPNAYYQDARDESVRRAEYAPIQDSVSTGPLPEVAYGSRTYTREPDSSLTLHDRYEQIMSQGGVNVP